MSIISVEKRKVECTSALDRVNEELSETINAGVDIRTTGCSERRKPKNTYMTKFLIDIREFPHLKTHVKHVTHVYCLTCIGGHMYTCHGHMYTCQTLDMCP